MMNETDLVANYDRAVELFSNEQYHQAERILLELLETNDDDFDVINFLGVIQQNSGNYIKAINYFNQVVFLYEGHAKAYYNLGYCYEKIGNAGLAAANFEKVISLDPQFIEAYLNLGQILITEEKFLEAEKLYNTAIQFNSGSSELYNNLAGIYFRLNKWDKAIINYKNALKYDSANCESYFNLGNCFSKMKSYDSAIENYEKAIQLKPDHSGALNNLALVHTKLNNIEAAINLYHRIISLNSKNAEAYFNLGFIMQETGKTDKAISNYKKALELDRDLKSAYVNIGKIFLQKGDTETAKKYFLNSIEDETSRVFAFTNLGVGSLEDLKINEAISFFDIAITSKSDLVEAHYNKAHALLLKGDYKNGWEEYEWRKQRVEFIKPKLTKPELNDQDIKDKRILVYAEQGLGDTIQFVRYLKLLKEKGCYVIFLSGSSLAVLFQNLEWIDELIVCNNLDELNVQYDYQIALLSLPHYFQTNGENIPSPEKYLISNFENDKIWSGFFKSTNNLKVGIVWAGNPENNRDKIRSVSLADFIPILSIKGIDFYSLQMGKAAVQLNDFYYPIVRLDQQIKNFADTASIINNLDLVISVDTSVVHLSGALGKPVWNLITYLPDWRWLLDRSETPWYSSMKLYRQQSRGNWKSVIDEVAYDLQTMVKSKEDKSIVIKTHSFPTEFRNTKSEKDIPLYLGLSRGDNFGWGVCSKYLRSGLSGKVETIDLDKMKVIEQNVVLPGNVFTAIKNNSLEGLYHSKGIKTYGYTFFENELTKTSLENAKHFDSIIAGSSWCEQKLKDAGIKETELLIQGIDPELFYPGEQKMNDNLFVIFSGGKFELRKGQDLVLRAFKILQQKYKDIILINTWYNFWREAMDTMQGSKHIRYQYEGTNWQDVMQTIYKINEIDPSRIFTLPLVPNEKLRDLYLKSDIALFPNRCEGGTNLVMMEYMACGKPVIASFNSGHKDILNEENSLPLKFQKDFRLFDEDQKIIADWSEPDLDEIVQKIEFAYHNRDKIKIIGNCAAKHLKKFTWANTADKLIDIIYKTN